MKPVILCILDGFGYGPAASDNAIAEANTPCFNKLFATCPYSLLEASGETVGLPPKQVGNSEVGHLSIGSGRLIQQDLPKINRAIESGMLANHPLLQQLPKNKTCHIIGLISDGGVHGHIDHTIALAVILETLGINVLLHAITDGRDCPPQSAKQYLNLLRATNIKIATLVGRYYALDRDQRWERTKLAYDLIIHGQGTRINNPMIAVKDSYADNISDEFIQPFVIGDYHGIQPGDIILSTNFRADRIKQLLETILLPESNIHVDQKKPKVKAIGMVPYGSHLEPHIQVLFPKEHIRNTLGEVIANAGKTQLRIAETEKYAHVTYFLNGGKEEPWPQEERILIPSPKVATYDLAPMMSAKSISDTLIKAATMCHYDFICVNYANADMVGHTGDLASTITAIETLDKEVARLVELVQNLGWHLLITADHGNAEHMLDTIHNQPHTAHTLNPVPFIYVGPKKPRVRPGTLLDVAPTILGLMGIKQPTNMTGKDLLS